MLHPKQTSYLAIRCSAEAETPQDTVYGSDIRSTGLLVIDRIMRLHNMARSQL